MTVLPRSAPASTTFYRSDVPGTERYRAQLLGWLDDVDDPQHAKEVRARLDSNDDVSHYSARFETVLGGLFRSRGWGVTFHPEVADVPTHPDFLVSTPVGEFYCEAVLVMDDAAQRDQERQLLEVVDRLERVRGPLVVWMRPLTPLPAGLRLKRVEAFLRRELAALDPAAVGPEPRSLLFADEIRAQPVEIEFLVMPGKEQADQPDAVVQMWGGSEARELTVYERIRGTLDGKAKRYGALDKPYLIATWVHTAGTILTDEQIARALYGDRRIELSRSVAETRLLQSRALNGVLTRPSHSRDGAANAVVSAVAVYSDLLHEEADPEHLLHIYHNPNAVLPLDEKLFSGQPQFVPRPSTADDSSAHMTWLNHRRRLGIFPVGDTGQPGPEGDKSGVPED